MAETVMLTELKRIRATYRKGDPLTDADLAFFLKHTKDIPEKLRALGSDYRLVANDLDNMRQSFEGFQATRSRMRRTS